MRRGINGLCDLIADLDLYLADAEGLNEQLRKYRKQHSDEYRAAMKACLPFRELWRALERAAVASQERAHILEAADEIEQRRARR